MTRKTSLPIPIHGIRHGIIHAGSGFLVTNGDTVWLTTCAHIVSGLIDTPSDPAYFMGGLLRPLCTDLQIPLYTNDHQRFSVVINKGHGHLVDALTIRLTASEAAALQNFDRFDVSDIVPAEVGDAVTMAGFPGLQSTLIASSSLDATVIETTGENFKLSKPSATGFSGGPVFIGDRLLGIVTGDVGHSGSFTNGLAASLSLLKPWLFALG